MTSPLPVDPTPGPVRRRTDRVLGWLRAGYPDGVPPQDYPALFGILQRRLTGAEFEQVVEDFLARSASEDTVFTRDDVERRIAEVLLGPALEDDVSRVSARLAGGGWPLGEPAEPAESDGGDTAAPRDGVVGRVVSWLRAGYPAGLPTTDYVPLLALLRRRLADDEVRRIGRELIDQGVVPASRADVGTAISGVTTELASDEDMERVRRYLADHGFPAEFTG